jgi:hypothetical protein
MLVTVIFTGSNLLWNIGNLILAEVTEIRIKRLLHKLSESSQTTLLRQRAQRAVLPGADLDSGPHTCMLHVHASALLADDGPVSADGRTCR